MLADEDILIKLPRDFRENMHAELFRTLKRCVSLSEPRNEYIRYLRMIASCRDDGEGEGDTRIVDPLTQEECLTAEANARQALADQWYLHQATDKEYEDEAEASERKLNDAIQQGNSKRAFAEACHNALRTTHGILDAEWRERHAWGAETIYRDTKTGQDEIESTRDPQRTYKQLTVFREADVIESCLDLRSIAPEHFYVWPVLSRSPDAADRCHVFMPLSRGELLQRVQTEGYDREAVRELTKSPAQSFEDMDLSIWDDLEDSDGDERPYPCFRVIGRMPFVLDEEGYLDSRTPPEYLYRDCEWIVCPGPDVVLRETLYRYPVRPFGVGVAHIRPESFGGDSPATQLAPLQNEATAMLRRAMDGAALICLPQYTAPKMHASAYAGEIGYAGHIIGIEPNSYLNPLAINPEGPQIALGMNQNAVARGRQDIAAEGLSQMMAPGAKVRKAEEVRAAMQLAATKFSVIAENFAFWLADMWPRIMVQVIDHEETDPDQPPVSYDDLVSAIRNRRFRVVPQVSSEKLSTQSRVQADMEAISAYSQSPFGQAALGQKDLSGYYRLFSELFAHLGWDPKSIIGGEDKWVALAEAAKQQEGANAGQQQPNGAGAGAPGGVGPMAGGAGVPGNPGETRVQHPAIGTMQAGG